jgi:hypothetical protein
MNDGFYRAMSDHKLQAAYVEVQQNVKAYPGEGWEGERDLLMNVAKERGIALDSSISSHIRATRGYLER